MRGLLHMPVTVMLLLSALLLKLLVLPDHWPWWGFFFFLFVLFPYTSSLCRFEEARWSRQQSPDVQPAVPQGSTPGQWRRS